MQKRLYILAYVGVRCRIKFHIVTYRLLYKDDLVNVKFKVILPAIGISILPYFIDSINIYGAYQVERISIFCIS